MKAPNPYQERGYLTRVDYLACLADQYGLPPSAVFPLADLLGPDEDFDGLISALDDLADGTHLDYLDYLDQA